jgi:simple sugar transport system permease protein
VSLYDLPDWLTTRVTILSVDTSSGRADLTILVVVMAACVAATWLLLRQTSVGRQLYAMGDNTEGARRVGVSIGAMHYTRCTDANSTCWPPSCSAAPVWAVAEVRF